MIPPPHPHNEISSDFTIMLTSPCKSDPPDSHFYIVKFGSTRESTIFIFLLLFKHRLWVLVRTASFLHLQKTKTQISCTVTTQVISAFFATKVQSLYSLIQNFKLLAICTAYFVLDLVGTSKDRFCMMRFIMKFHQILPLCKSDPLDSHFFCSY